MQRFYLDHNATSPLRDDLREHLVALLADPPLNAGSVHQEGQRARGIVERARRLVLRSLPGAMAGSLTFVSGATEANNLALRGIAPSAPLVVSALEHPSIRDTATQLGERGRELRWLRHDDRGIIDLDDLRRAVDGAGLVTLMAANNELGNLNPIDEVAAICADAGVPLHLDAAQLWMRAPLAIPEGVSAMSLAAHKAGGPKGIGALWLRKGVGLEPQQTGGHQERGRRAGTEDVLMISAMGALAAAPNFESWSRLASFRDRFESALVEELGAVINGAVETRLPNTTNLSIRGREAEELVMALDLAGIAMSAGSACTAGSMDVSPVIAALGFDEARTRGALRFSFGPRFEEAWLEELISRVVGAIRRFTP